MSKKILINFAHPALNKSTINKRLRRVAKDHPAVKFNDLYAHYPDFHIDVAREQRLVEENDIIIFQHPFYWYSSPAIIKEWQDLVLEPGWAFDDQPTALAGKIMLNVTSTGSEAHTYCNDDYQRYTIREFLRPFEQTAYLCGITYLPPFVIYGTDALKEDVPGLKHMAQKFHRFLDYLAEEQLDLTALVDSEHLTFDDAMTRTKQTAG